MNMELNLILYLCYVLAHSMGIALQLLYKNIESDSNIYVGELKKKTNLIFMFISTKNSLYLKISKVLRVLQL